MVKYPTILNLPQKDLNRQLYDKIMNLEQKNKALVERVTDLEERVTALEE